MPREVTAWESEDGHVYPTELAPLRPTPVTTSTALTLQRGHP